MNYYTYYKIHLNHTSATTEQNRTHTYYTLQIHTKKNTHEINYQFVYYCQYLNFLCYILQGTMNKVILH